MPEIWKDIPGYEGCYQVSNYGKVKSLDRYIDNKTFRRGKIITPRVDTYGYHEIRLSRNGKKKPYRANRLVWFTFMGGDLNYYNPKEKTIVCHKNNIRIDNRINNLYIGTQGDNIKQGCIDGNITYRFYPRKKERNTILMKLIYKTGKYSKASISKRFGYHETYLGKILKSIS